MIAALVGRWHVRVDKRLVRIHVRCGMLVANIFTTILCALVLARFFIGSSSLSFSAAVFRYSGL